MVRVYLKVCGPCLNFDTVSSRALNLERRLDHDGHPAALPSTDGVTPPTFIPNGIPTTWSWRDTSANGEHQVCV